MLANSRVFEDEHLPRRLLHREGAVDTLLRAWEPALSDWPETSPADVLVNGPPGVGKTALTRHALQIIVDEGGVQSARVPCSGRSSAGIARALIGELTGETPWSGKPEEDCWLAVREQVRDQPTIVVLDEADDVVATDALTRLGNIPNVAVVAICHDADDWQARLDDSARRRLDLRTLGLDRFGVTELADILEARARVGLAPNAVSRDVLEAIADHVAGVAREGIQTLRGAATVAAERQSGRIDNEHIEPGYQRARERIRERNLTSLGFHHHVLYELVRQAGPLDGHALHQLYDDRADGLYADRAQTPISKRARRYKLEKLTTYDLVEYGDEYDVVDENLKTPVEIPIT